MDYTRCDGCGAELEEPAKSRPSTAGWWTLSLMDEWATQSFGQQPQRSVWHACSWPCVATVADQQAERFGSDAA